MTIEIPSGRWLDSTAMNHTKSQGKEIGSMENPGYKQSFRARMDNWFVAGLFLALTLMCLFFVSGKGALYFTIVLSAMTFFFICLSLHYSSLSYVLSGEGVAAKSVFLKNDLKWADVVDIEVDPNSRVSINTEKNHIQIDLMEIKGGDDFLVDISHHVPGEKFIQTPSFIIKNALRNMPPILLISSGAVLLTGMFLPPWIPLLAVSGGVLLGVLNCTNLKRGLKSGKIRNYPAFLNVMLLVMVWICLRSWCKSSGVNEYLLFLGLLGGWGLGISVSFLLYRKRFFQVDGVKGASKE